MVLPKEATYIVAQSSFPNLKRQVRRLQPQGVVNSSNLRAEFLVEASETALIAPQTVRLCGKIAEPENKYINNSYASLIESVTVYTASGREVSRNTDWWRLHSATADIEADATMAQMHWEMGLDKRADFKTVPFTSPADTRSFAIPLTLAGLFSTQSLIYPRDFGGLRIIVQLRPPSACVAGSAPSYTLSDVELVMDYMDMQADPVALKTYQQQPEGGRLYHFHEVETFKSSVGASDTLVRVQCPTRMSSIRRLLTGLYTSGGSEVRLRGNIASYQVKVGSAVYPQQRVDTEAQLYAMTQNAYGGLSRGILSRDKYLGDRFIIGHALATQSLASGLDPKDAVVEVLAECSAGVGQQCEAVTFVQADAVYNASLMTVDK